MIFMKYNNLLLLILIFSVIISINFVSATNVTDDNLSFEYSTEDIDITDVAETFEDVSTDYKLSESFENNLSENNQHVIWVGPNAEDGNGSENNPFSNFDLARDDVSSGKDNVIINVFDGTYDLESHLKFNSSNVHIIGLGDNVIIKNKYNTANSKQAFGLIPTSGNFTISNVLFDGSTWTQRVTTNQFYTMFQGTGNYIVTLNNCTFYEFANFIPPCGQPYYPLIFNGCTFLSTAKVGYKVGALVQHNATFKNCIFNLDTVDPIASTLSNVYVSLEDCWFGINGIPKYFYGSMGEDHNYHFISYGIFKVYENYLGNNTYEIIGILFRNGTSEIIESINSMVVNLTSDSGELNQTTAILENGTFKVIYISTSANHKITATLDNAVESVEFQSINMSLDASSIAYGDKQNITVTLPNEYNGVIYVSVNGKTYNKTLELNNVVTIDLTDVLPVGTYDVNVTFIDKIDNETCAIYGFNTTTITVAKVSNYDFDATITPNTVYLGDNATVTLSLPDGATGNVTVKVGDNKAKIFNSDDIISIDGFVAGNNVVNITFTSDIYDAKSVEKTIVASAKPTTIATVNVTTTYNVAKDLIITLTDVNGKVLANKTVNVVVGTVNNNLTTNTSGQVSIDVSTLAPNTYVANIAFAGDEVYAKANATANVVVNKIASSLTAPAVTATYNVGKNLVITLTANGKALANQKVTVKVGTISKTLTTNAKGQVSVDVSKLTPKTYTATFTYAGDDINDKSSNTAKVVVNKAKPKITSKKATFKAKKKTKKYSIVLKDNKGKAIKKAKVTLKVKGKTYKATTNAKGKATFKITKLTKKGKQTATIKFGGNTLYKAVSKKVKLTIKK